MNPAVPPVPAAPRRGLPPWSWGLLGAGLVGVAWVLWRFEPAGQFFFPRCHLHALTGLDCPGCGGLRATHALLHGDVAAAWRLNPLLVFALPWLGWTLVAVVAARAGRRWPNPLAHPAGIATAAVVAILFGILRNVPSFRPWLGG